MAKKATAKSGVKKSMTVGSRSRSVAAPRRSSGGGQKNFDAGEAFVKLLQSPLVAELVAVAATAALASLAEHGFSSSQGTRGKRAGKAVKEAGKAAAAAVGRRLSNEIEEIRAASKGAKGGAKA
jgi:hypothetical protein